jgi:hypothetical protein
MDYVFWIGCLVIGVISSLVIFGDEMIEPIDEVTNDDFGV